MKNLLLGTAALALVAACASRPDVPPADLGALDALVAGLEAPAAEPGKFVTAEGLVLSASDDFGAWGIDLTAKDTSVHPGDDFYRYANGIWLDDFVMPADRTRYGSFDLLREKSEQRVHRIIEELAASNPPADTIEGKIARYFNAYMDTDSIEAAGLAPAEPVLAQIRAASSREDLADLFAAPGIPSPIGIFIDIDSKQTDRYIAYINEGGLGMGDRDYYLVDSERNLELRGKYLDMLEVLLGEAGYDDPRATAESVLALETQIAHRHWDRTVGRNRNLTHNNVGRSELIGLAGEFPVARMLEGLGLAGENEFIVRQLTPTPEQIAAEGLSEEDAAKIMGGGVPGVIEVMQTAPIEQWQAYLTAQYLRAYASVLPARIDEAVFEFSGRALTGAQEQPPRWRRAVAAVENALGEGVGQVYAARHFPPEKKAAMDELVANLTIAMAANLDDLDWMSEATKVEARDKLAKFTPKIGYPDTFKTYDLVVAGDDPVANSKSANLAAWQESVARLGQPIDRGEWFMLPQTVNAYYAPNRNEIVFPAGILQPPFFNLSADPAVNYGGIGGVIGHEIGHGFDDQGARSDGDGVLRNWWTPEDAANFRDLTDALVAQYNQFCPLDDGQTCVNGRLGLGENIGDLGGLSMAYRAYKLSLNGEEAPVIDGLTGDQRFFLGWAQIWRSVYREEALRRQIIQGPHSPPEFRVNGIVRNMDEWYEAFGIGPDHALYLPPEERIRIW